jgi:hypothetical protein
MRLDDGRRAYQGRQEAAVNDRIKQAIAGAFASDEMRALAMDDDQDNRRARALVELAVEQAVLEQDLVNCRHCGDAERAGLVVDRLCEDCQCALKEHGAHSREWIERWLGYEG